MYFSGICFILAFLNKKTGADPIVDFTPVDNMIKDQCILDVSKFRVPDRLDSRSPYSENSCFNTLSCETYDPNFFYRTVDGKCNNRCNPSFGAAGVPFRRNMSSRYSDGRYMPAKSKDGCDLPPARLVRKAVFPDGEILDSDFTVFFMQYGQGIAHDTLYSVNKTITKPGCPSLKVTDVYMPIEIPKNDTYFSKCFVPATANCMEYPRSKTSECATTEAKQITNFCTSFLDLSYVYGSEEEEAKEVRLFKDGLLKFQTINGSMFLPPGDEDCLNCPFKKAKYCFHAGDDRVNQHAMLAALQTLYLREHNRIAKILAEKNPLWDDETIFQEAREMNIGMHQIITVRDWLVKILGEKTMIEMDLFPRPNYCGDCADCDIDATSVLSFNTGCFRYFHTIIRSDVLFYDGPNKQTGSMKLSDTFNIPDVTALRFDELMQGMIYAAMQKADTLYTEEVTQKMFKRCKKCGNDLIAMDIQRQGDHGLPTYNDAREYCGFPRACTFDDFADFIKDKAAIEKLKQLYKHPDDVQLIVGSSLEDHVDGCMIGPTCKCITALQFKSWICGDRFWFPKYFSPEQAKEVIKVTAAHLICNNVKVTHVPKDPFRMISSSNPLIECSCLEQPNMNYWVGAPRVLI